MNLLAAGSATRGVRERVAPLVVITTGVAVIAVAPVVARVLGLLV